MTLLEQTIQFVDSAYQGEQKAHFERAVYWLEQFLSNATEAHRVAAYAHDIERAFRNADTRTPDDYLDAEFLRHHQEEGARIMREFLKQANADEDTIRTVVHLISKHEVGGDNEQNAVMDADSVSFFETNAEMFVHKKAAIEGYEKVRQKLDWMFERISTDEHREYARKNYERLMSELEAYKN